MKRWGVLAGILLVCALGCSKKAGDSCKGDKLVCADKKTALSCHDGKYVAVACKGAKGCKKKKGEIRCDVSANEDGDECTANLSNKGDCSPDGKSWVVCHKGKFRVLPCRGPKACKSRTCDTTMGNEGDQCRRNDSYACSPDKKRQVVCKVPEGADVGKVELARTCRGPKACTIDGDNINCDLSVAKVGDKCKGTGAACSEDHKAMLKCADAKMAVDVPCRGENGCRVDGTKIRCDRSQAEVGDPCTSGGACSVDRRKLLTCRDGKFVVRRNCYRSCKSQGTRVVCR